MQKLYFWEMHSITGPGYWEQRSNAQPQPFLCITAQAYQ